MKQPSIPTPISFSFESCLTCSCDKKKDCCKKYKKKGAHCKGCPKK